MGAVLVLLKAALETVRDGPPCLALPCIIQVGRPTILQLSCLVWGTHSSTCERGRVRCHQIGVTK